MSVQNHLDNYTIIDKIGEGGFSEVFKATHLRFNLTVAIKILKSIGQMKNTEGLKSFNFELRIKNLKKKLNLLKKNLI
jgi:serine/threonine protein kinase